MKWTAWGLSWSLQAALTKRQTVGPMTQVVCSWTVMNKLPLEFSGGQSRATDEPVAVAEA